MPIVVLNKDDSDTYDSDKDDPDKDDPDRVPTRIVRMEATRMRDLALPGDDGAVKGDN